MPATKKISSVRATVHHDKDGDQFLITITTSTIKSQWDTIDISQHDAKSREIVWSDEISIDELIEFLQRRAK